MLKYMKYEIKGTYKFMSMLLLGILGASTGVQLSIYRRAMVGSNYSLADGPFSSPLSIVLLILIIFGAFVTAFFYIVGSFRKELYEDRGYLTFTLPITGNQILGSKVIIAFMWLMGIGLTTVLYNLGLLSILFGREWMKTIRYYLFYVNSSMVITILLSGLVSGLITLLLIYFSITISRVSIKSKKLGGLWFILFLVLNALVSFVTIRISESTPYYFDVTNFKFLHEDSIFRVFGRISHTGTLSVTHNGDVLLNIGMMVFSILVAVVTFYATSYLIERKVDL